MAVRSTESLAFKAGLASKKLGDTSSEVAESLSAMRWDPDGPLIQNDPAAPACGCYFV